MKSPSILLVINSIGSGGAERVLANLVAARGSDLAAQVHLALLDDLPHMRDIGPLEALHILDGRGSLVRSARQLRQLVHHLQPDIVASFLIRANCAAVLACRGLPIRTILCERMHPGSHLALNHPGKLRRTLAKAAICALYPRADRILAVSEGVRTNLIDSFGIPPDQIRTIANPYDLEAIRSAGQSPPDIELPEDFCVSVGRLVPAKDMATVIRTFAATRPTKHLLIIGEGPEEVRLRTLAHQHGIGDAVHFPGYSQNPFAIVSRAQFLVSASRNEGFPNAAAEAMALGVPVILTDCPSGPAELLENGKHGMLVPLDDQVALAAAMRAMTDSAQRARLATLASHRMTQFTLPVIARAYWREFLESPNISP